jgi:hypothetical protein
MPSRLVDSLSSPRVSDEPNPDQTLRLGYADSAKLVVSGCAARNGAATQLSRGTRLPPH